MRQLLLFLLLPVQLLAQQLKVLEGKAQGTYYIIKYISTDTASLQPGIDSIFAAIDHSLSLYQPNSLINLFNQEGRIMMDVHMQAVIKKALVVSQITGGAFDITVKPLVDVWGFGVKQPVEKHIPAKDTITRIMQHVGYRYLHIKGNELIATKAGVAIDCNGIAQGYTSDEIGRYLDSKAIKNYLVDVGGELSAKGKNMQQHFWTIGIETPDSSESKILSLQNQAITTSGSYRRFFEKGGVRYSHTIDPRSGQSLHNNIISVTVVAPDAITADGFDNALILMGVDRSFEFIRQHPELKLAAGFIFMGTDNHIHQRFSENFPK